MADLTDAELDQCIRFYQNSGAPVFRALSELRRRREGGKLRPIESAPQDETRVELYWPDDSPFNECTVRAGFWSEEGRDWFESESDSNSLTELLGHPTHWRPLPPAPSEDIG